MYLWLQRSKSEPLSIHLDIRGYSMESDPNVHEYLIALFSHIARWKTALIHLEYQLIHFPSWKILQGSIEGPAPLLESLSVVSNRAEFNHTELEILPFRLWIAAPALRQLVVTMDDMRGEPNEQFSIWTLPHRIPYHQLTHLRLRAIVHTADIITWKDVHTIFASAPNLVSCFFEGVERSSWTAPGADPIPSPILLRHLQHLYLRASWYSSVEVLPHQLDRILTAPSLITLTFVNSKRWQQACFTRFITRSSCALEELCVVDIMMGSHDLVELMELSPSLKIIHLNSMNTLVNLVVARRLMTWDDTAHRFSLGSNLQQILVSADLTVRDAGHSISVLRKLFKTRLCPPIGSPKTFTMISVPSVLKWETRSCLKELSKEPWGLQVITNKDLYDNDELWKRSGGK